MFTPYITCEYIEIYIVKKHFFLNFKALIFILITISYLVQNVAIVIPHLLQKPHRNRFSRCPETAGYLKNAA